MSTQPTKRKRDKSNDKDEGLQRKKRKESESEWNPFIHPYVILDFDSIIADQKQTIFNSLSITHLNDDIKLVIFEYVKYPFEHLGASFKYKHKSTGLVIYNTHDTINRTRDYFVIEKCDVCFSFFNQTIAIRRYDDASIKLIKDLFIYPKYQCCVCKKNRCHDCGGFPYNIDYKKIPHKLTCCFDDACRVKDGPHGTVTVKSSLHCLNQCGDYEFCERHQNCSECCASKKDCHIYCRQSKPSRVIACGGYFCAKKDTRCRSKCHEIEDKYW
eukprot:26152_1